MSTIRYIADLHWGHRNIVAYDNRPFSSIEEMDEALVTLWNETVQKDDVTYVVGDMIWSNKYQDWENLLLKLNGSKVIVKGNHDRTEILDKLKAHSLIVDWSHQLVVKDDQGRHIILNHSPMPFFVNMHVPNWYHLYGHTHVSFDYQITLNTRRLIEELYLHEIRMYNVGCMIPGMNYIPHTLDEIIDIDKRITRASTIEYDVKKHDNKEH